MVSPQDYCLFFCMSTRSAHKKPFHTHKTEPCVCVCVQEREEGEGESMSGKLPFLDCSKCNIYVFFGFSASVTARFMCSTFCTLTFNDKNYQLVEQLSKDVYSQIGHTHVSNQ